MTVSQFSFVYPSSETQSNGDTNKKGKSLIIDEDGDLIVERKRSASIKIAHQLSTELKFVGLQVWRGALILADFVSRLLFSLFSSSKSNIWRSRADTELRQITSFQFLWRIGVYSRLARVTFLDYTKMFCGKSANLYV